MTWPRLSLTSNTNTDKIQIQIHIKSQTQIHTVGPTTRAGKAMTWPRLPLHIRYKYKYRKSHKYILNHKHKYIQPSPLALARPQPGQGYVHNQVQIQIKSEIHIQSKIETVRYLLFYIFPKAFAWNKKLNLNKIDSNRLLTLYTLFKLLKETGRKSERQ